MKPAKDDIKRYTSQALQRSVDAYSGLDDRDWRRKASGHWTAQDYLAHLVVMQEKHHDRLIQAALAGGPAELPGFTDRESINDYNEELLGEVRDVPAGELLERYKAAFEGGLRTLDGLADADLDKPAENPEWARTATVRDLFFSSYLHIPGHYQDIRRVSKRKLAHWIEEGSPEEVHFQLDRIFHFMPLIYWPDRGGDIQATYLFNIEGTGGGQWAVGIAGGKAETEEGSPESFDVEVRTKPVAWIDLSTGDLNAMWAITTRKVAINGDTGLAMKLNQLFQVNP